MSTDGRALLLGSGLADIMTGILPLDGDDDGVELQDTQQSPTAPSVLSLTVSPPPKETSPRTAVARDPSPRDTKSRQILGTRDAPLSSSLRMKPQFSARQDSAFPELSPPPSRQASTRQNSHAVDGAPSPAGGRQPSAREGGAPAGPSPVETLSPDVFWAPGSPTPAGMGAVFIDDYMPVPERGEDMMDNVERDAISLDDGDEDDWETDGSMMGRGNAAGEEPITRAEIDAFREDLLTTPKYPHSFWSEQDTHLQHKEHVRLRPKFKEHAVHAKQFSKEDLVTMTANYSSQPLRLPHTQVYRAYHALLPKRGTGRKWMLMFFIALFIALLGMLLEQNIAWLSHARENILIGAFKEARERNDGTTGFQNLGPFLLWMLSGLALVAVSTALVHWQPSSGGVGVTDVMAYLNGLRFGKVFTMQTLAAKWLSCICAVSSGLPVDPEGPMIHVGAIVGAGLAMGRSKTLKVNLKKLFRVGINPKDHRDAITAGAAAAVATAFGSPIGGLLFVFEEVATHWSPSLTPMIFFCCLMASFVSTLFKSMWYGWVPRHEVSFGTINQAGSVTFPTAVDTNVQVAEIFFCIVLGLVCGLVAVAFTVLNVAIATRRTNFIRMSKLYKHGEPLIVCALYLVVSYFIPSFFACEPLPANFGDASGSAESAGEEEAVLGRGFGVLGGGFGATGLMRRTAQTLGAGAGAGVNGSAFLDAGCLEEGTYNLAATLFWPNGHAVAALLFTKPDGLESYLPMVVFGVVYFFFSCYSCGMAISSGIVLPKLVTGGIIGRVFGVFINKNIANTHHSAVYAIVGAGAYFAGVSRLTVSLAVIMVELTGAQRVLILVLVASMTAKLTADACTHSLYHRLLEIRAVPFLDVNVIEELENNRYHCFRAADICRKEVICLRGEVSVKELRCAFRGSTHSSFPVLDEKDRYIGIVTRDTLYAVLWVMERHRRFRKDAHRPLDLPNWGEIQKVEKAMFGKQGTMQPDCIKTNGASPWDDVTLEILRYIDTSALTVTPSVAITEVMRLYMTMGLRCIPVVNLRGQVTGIFTRKELLPSQVLKKIKVAAARLERGGRERAEQTVLLGSPASGEECDSVLPSDIQNVKEHHKYL